MELSFSCFNLVIYKKAQLDKSNINRNTWEDNLNPLSKKFEPNWDLIYLFQIFIEIRDIFLENTIVMRIFASKVSALVFFPHIYFSHFFATRE